MVPVLPMVPEGYTLCDICQRAYKTKGFTKHRNNCLKKIHKTSFINEKIDLKLFLYFTLP